MIKKALGPVRRRMHMQRGIRGISIGLMAAAGLCLAIAIASFFMPLQRLSRLFPRIMMLLPLLSGFLFFLFPISANRAALQADSCGLKERATTALSLAKADSAMTQLQREDALSSLHALPVKEAMPLRFAGRHVAYAAGMVVITVGLLFLPNPQFAVIKEQEETQRKIQAQADMVEKMAEKAAPDTMTPKEQNEYRRITGDMARALRTAKDEREALSEIGKAQEDLKRLQADMQQRMAQDTARAMGQQPALSSLQSALEAQSAQQMQAAMQALEAALASEGEEGAAAAQALADALEAAAEAMEDSALSEMMAAAAKAAQAGDLSNLSDLLAGLTSGSPMQGVNMELLAQLARSGMLGTGTPMEGDGDVMQLMGLSQGTQPGQGAGHGTTNEDMGYIPGYTQSNQGEGSEDPKYRLGEFERIYDPSRIGGDGDTSQLTGPRNAQGDGMQMQLGPGMGDMAGQVPYTEVIGDYQEAAVESMQRRALPGALQEFVNRYFDSLVE